MTARPNSAARAPSTTRWSKVTAIVPVGRATISPFLTTGRSATRPMLRIPTSGWLTIGVVSRPPSLPALVMVKVEPRSSSRVAVAHDRDDESLIRLDGDAEVVAVEIDDLVALEARVQLRDSP